ncbi:SDR family NAD(P)-dependent oxidoreductase [Aeoliella mucimassa]|uniref:3-oxoacyl-[acyl-carrier-protein] reductase FabG n=1 Tax=Aeoliella mucimassa TaxID=2527972 RepID=A0A518ATQ4_9BACT|nr:SDR family oxidoreductase [Aeoliella mucimassa]QDU58113.1 3-oxoacyl-[acyl-carrier-protein] reductase FabG [Aeoliella mucimassa]
MPLTLDNRVALITGSTRGLGKVMALALARSGARVAMNFYGNQALAEESFADLQAIGGEHCLVRADVTDEQDVDRLVAEVADKIGPVDILVPNATCEQPLMPIEEYDWSFFQRMVDFFQKSPFLLTKACLPHMREQGWGRIVHITSEVYPGSWANFCPYASAKGGQTGLARSNAREFAPYGVTVNIIAPGWIPVERHAGATDEERADYLATAPMGKFGEPTDIANALLYLVSEEAHFVTGATLDVNGGRTIY